MFGGIAAASPSRAITAALPTAAPAHPRPNVRMTMRALWRAEQIVETLRTKYVADGWALFEPAVEEMFLPPASGGKAGRQ
jgi:hypothetical protein